MSDGISRGTKKYGRRDNAAQPLCEICQGEVAPSSKLRCTEHLATATLANSIAKKLKSSGIILPNKKQDDE